MAEPSREGLLPFEHVSFQANNDPALKIVGHETRIVRVCCGRGLA
jgi:hypothetical protein